MSTVQDFIDLVTVHGSKVDYFRTVGFTVCPCLTPEGFRDPEWHLAHPSEPECNAEGMLPSGTSTGIAIRGFVQPAQSTRITRLADEYLTQMFGQVQADDHIGIFPCKWAGKDLNFRDWSQTGAEYVSYDGQKFMVVNANLIPDPSDGNPSHHWETALRLIA